MLKFKTNRFTALTVLACLALSIIAGPSSSSALQCSQILSFSSKLATPRSLESLIKKMDVMGITLELRHEIDLFDSSNDYFEIHAIDKDGDSVGEITMAPERIPVIISGEERSLYSSHIDVTVIPKKNMKGTGLGTYLYAAAARTMFKIGGALFSSTQPSGLAKRTWESMVGSNWAVVGNEKGSNLNDRSSSFRFRDDLLRNGFFEELDQRIEDRDDVFLLLGED